MKTNEKLNLTMLCDFYELTMGNGYFVDGKADQICYFDVFFRNVPDGGGFAIAAGLEQVVEYIQQLHFSEDDIEFLKSKNIFSEKFLDYLRNFHFSGDIYAVREGTPIFPGEPILTVRAPALEAQLVETYVLLALNHQTMIATKASRIVRAAQGRAVLEFGSRRAQGADAAIIGARAAYIGGCAGTACTLTDKMYGVPAGVGTYVESDRRLDAALASAVMGIQAIKGVEIGDGFLEAMRPGSQAHDEMVVGDDGRIARLSNRAGGIEGGMSNGQPIVVRAAMKPIPSIPKALRTVDVTTGEPAQAINQRSDNTAVPAAAVVAEAMVRLTIAQYVLEKFGGDCVAETKRNAEQYVASWPEHMR